MNTNDQLNVYRDMLGRFTATGTLGLPDLLRLADAATALGLSDGDVENDLRALKLACEYRAAVGIIDRLREDVLAAKENCRRAGRALSDEALADLTTKLSTLKREGRLAEAFDAVADALEQGHNDGERQRLAATLEAAQMRLGEAVAANWLLRRLRESNPRVFGEG